MKSKKNKSLLTVNKIKPYYSSDRFELYNGDSLELLELLPENSVDMVFADPPYFLSSGSFTCQNGKMVSVKKGDWDMSNGIIKNFEFHQEWIKRCRRILKPNGTIWISGTYHSIYQCGFALQMNGFHILNDVSWFKPNASPNLSCRFFTASHETLIWARKDKKAKHTFNYDLMKNGNWAEDKFKKPGLQMRSVWSINTPKPIEKKFGKHPTQKPSALLKRIVLASTNEGDIIVDPFTGSSTTGLAAYYFGRKFIGIDNEKNYLDLSIQRFEALNQNLEFKLPEVIIPSYVTKWTDKYFHQSAFDVPVGLPNKKVIAFLSSYKPSSNVVLYRGVHKYNDDDFSGVESWTYDKTIASNYAKSEKNGKILKKEFSPDVILLDTTILNPEEKKQLGYDYKIDDKEVLVIKQ